MGSNLVNCKACGKEIGQSVKKCIHCGTDQRNFFIRHKIITFFLVMFIIGTIANAVSTNKAVTSTSTTSNQVSAPEIHPVQLTTKQLDQEYNDNQFNADEKYKGKLLEVTGPIITVDRDSDNNPYIHYAATDNSLVSVWCNFNEGDTSFLAKVDKNYEITVQGECVGIEKNILSSNIILNNCKLINVSTKPIPEDPNYKGSLLYQFNNNQTQTRAPASETNEISPQQSDTIATMRRTYEENNPSTYFTESGSPVIVSDGNGGYITAVHGTRYPTVDGYGQLVFFWHNNDFIGWDATYESTLSKISNSGPGYFVVSYAHYAQGDPLAAPSLPDVAITYKWNGSGFTPSGTPPQNTTPITVNYSK